MSGEERAKGLRSRATPEERLLWGQLRDRRLGGLKFRRQHPLGPYVVDFCCAGRALVVEVDGSGHLDREAADAARTDWLEQQGYRVLRVWNHEVRRAMPVVLQAILDAAREGERRGGEKA